MDVEKINIETEQRARSWKIEYGTSNKRERQKMEDGNKRDRVTE